jgi:glycerol-3-phosphate dehydrogenase
MSILSSLHRQEIIRQLSAKKFDLVVIGGGITGAGIALDAASRGLTVALLEKSDFASGTSSKSTKLVHGGLRYLKQLEIGLVQEVGRERAIVHRLAPHLVIAEKMLLPLVKGGTYGEFTTSIGLWAYDLLAGVEGDEKRRMLNREETLDKEPLLNAENLAGGGLYAEYRTDDARLTIENIKTAAGFGAIALNYAGIIDFIYEDEKIAGVKCRDTQTGEVFEVRSRFTVNAAGPWVDGLRKIDNSIEGKRIILSKGVHVVVPHVHFPLRQSVYFDAPDGRMIFSIPRGRVTYIGTTDTPYEGDLDNVPVFQEDADYLLNAVNRVFPTVNLGIKDIESSWAGLRSLIYEGGKSVSEMSRKDEVFISDTGLISIAGGKLTGYRKMAERIVDLIAQKYHQEFGATFKPGHTHRIPLVGDSFLNASEVMQYRQDIREELREYRLDEYYADELVANYGKQTGSILKRFAEYDDPPEIALARAETWHAVHFEMALTPNDFYNRRSGRLYFNIPSIPKTMNAVLEDFKAYLGWDENKLDVQRKSLEETIYTASHFEYSKSAGITF